MSDSVVSQIGWYLLFSLFICMGFSVIGGSLFKRFGSVGLGVYWVVITIAFTAGCVIALGGGTLVGVLTYLPIMLCLVGLPTGLAMQQLTHRQINGAQISGGQASTFLFSRSVLLIPVGMIVAYGVNVAEDLLVIATH